MKQKNILLKKNLGLATIVLIADWLLFGINDRSHSPSRIAVYFGIAGIAAFLGCVFVLLLLNLERTRDNLTESIDAAIQTKDEDDDILDNMGAFQGLWFVFFKSDWVGFSVEVDLAFRHFHDLA